MSAKNSVVAELLDQEGDVVSEQDREILELAATIDSGTTNELVEQLKESQKPVIKVIENMNDDDLNIIAELEQEEIKEKFYSKQAELDESGGMDLDVDENTVLAQKPEKQKTTRKRAEKNAWYFTEGAFGDWVNGVIASNDGRNLLSQCIMEAGLDETDMKDLVEYFEKAPEKVKAKLVNLLDARDFKEVSIFTRIFFDYLDLSSIVVTQKGIAAYYESEANGSKAYGHSTAVVQAKQMQHLTNALNGTLMINLTHKYRVWKQNKS